MILEAKNVEYEYKSQKERKVLDNISVRFEEKKFYTGIDTSNPIVSDRRFCNRTIQRNGWK